MEPLRTTRSTALLACTSPNRLSMPTSSMAGVALWGVLAFIPYSVSRQPAAENGRRSKCKVTAQRRSSPASEAREGDPGDWASEADQRSTSPRPTCSPRPLDPLPLRRCAAPAGDDGVVESRGHGDLLP